MLTLHPTLQAAMDGLSRKPIIKLLATQVQESLPFDGAYFNGSSTSELHNAAFTSDTGSIVGVFVRNGTNLVQVRTDTNRTFWDETVSPTYYGTIQNLTAVELADGNIGVIITSGQTIKRTVLDAQSNVVAAVATIQTLASPETPKDPAAAMLTDGSFLLAYIVYDSTAETYQVRTRISADFLTWSAASAITLAGLLNTRKIGNLALFNTSTGGLLLFFDYVTAEKDDGETTVSNIFCIRSDDSGISWGTPQQITNYTEWGTSCVNPSVAERVNGDLALAYTDQRMVLSADKSTLLWQTECSKSEATRIQFDSATRRLYVYQIFTYVGYKSLCGIVVINVDTWEVIRSYTTQTSPDYHDIFANEHVWYQKDRGEAHYVVFSTYYATKALCVIDDQQELVTHYFFNSDDNYEITQNVDIVWPYNGNFGVEGGARIRATWTDAAAKRVYVAFGNSYLYTRAVIIGYIDLTDSIDAATGKYPWHAIYSSLRYFEEAQIMGLEQIIVVPERNFIIVMAASALPNHAQYPGRTSVIDMTSGEVLKEFTTVTHSMYPQGGLHHGCYYEGCLYASFDYTTLDDQENFRGMAKLNIDTEEITHHRPTWATLNNYRLVEKVPTGDGRILVAVIAYNNGAIPGGVGVFHIDSGAWEFYSKESLQGFESGTAATCYSVAYDADERQIMVGSIYEPLTIGFIGVRMFDEDGSYNMGKLVEGINSAGWVWGTPEDLTKGRLETDMAVAVDPDNVLWSIWTHQDDTEYSAQWDRDVVEKEMDDLLVAGEPVTLNWSVDKTGTLSFTVSHGHLFDQNNLYSTWSEFLKQGKLIEVSIGERIGGVDYWQTQGKYVVDDQRVEYQRDVYPVLRVDCVSKDFIWGDIEVPATQRFDTNAPEEMVAGLLMDIAKLNIGAISIPTFPNRHEIHHQWVDVDFRSIIEEILDHFQCVSYFDMDGIFSPRVLSFSKAVAHAYTGTEIRKFTPNNKYSSFTNRIVVNGEGLYFIQVTYDEELQETIMGTCGWWDDDEKIIRVNYSNDLDLICYDPRMVVKTSIKDFKILWSESGGDEFISYVDPNNRYCEITIICPGIMDVLIAAIALLVAVGTAAMLCDLENGCGYFIFALSIVSSAVNYILGQVASWHYEVYAKPTGEEKQLVSWTADDVEFQEELGGVIVTETFDDPFCYTTQSCKEVAEHELAICRAQRKRVSFEKIGHLQDEICDIISIEHPYSKAVLNVFITDLTRTYTRPVGPSDDGGLIDTITGWRL